MTIVYKMLYVKAPVNIRTNPPASGVFSDELQKKFINIGVDDSSTYNFEIEDFGSENSPEITPNPPRQRQTVAGYYYLGCKVNSAVYGNSSVRTALKLFYTEDLNEDEKTSSLTKARNYNEVSSLGYMKSVNVTFLASSPTSVYAPWGVKHRSYVLYSSLVGDFQTAKKVVIGLTFKIGTGTSVFDYKVDPDTISERSRRKAKPI